MICCINSETDKQPLVRVFNFSFRRFVCPLEGLAYVSSRSFHATRYVLTKVVLDKWIVERKKIVYEWIMLDTMQRRYDFEL